VGFCTNCGAAASGARYCTSCGAQLTTDGSSLLRTEWEPASRKRNVGRSMAALLGILVITVGAAAGAWSVGLLGQDSVDSPQQPAAERTTPDGAATPTDGTPSTATSTPSAAGTENPTAVDSHTDPPIATLPAAGGTPFWTVIVASKTEAEGGRLTVEEFAAALEGRGYAAEVFHSSAHTSLRPGYWVAASGRFAGREDASDAAFRLKSDAGFDIAYPRCVGTAAQCS
jgi:hypothetical protein